MSKRIKSIWAGGQKKLPEADQLNLLRWLQRNPNIILHLVVDQASDPEATTEYYREQFQYTADQAGIDNVDIDARIVCRDLAQINEDITAETAQWLTAGERGPTLLQAVRYAIDGLRPQYGTSSDLLRYGDGYLDEEATGYIDSSDVTPGQTPLSALELFAPDQDISVDEEQAEAKSSEHILYVDHLSQQVEVELASEHFERFNLSDEQTEIAVGNDTLFYSPRNPLMGLFCQQALDRLAFWGERCTQERASQPQQTTEGSERKVTDTQEDLTAFLMLAYKHSDPNFMREFVVDSTGPGLVRRIIGDERFGPLEQREDVWIKMVGDQQVFIRPVRFRDCRATYPVKNTENWLKAGVVRCDSLERALTKAMTTIEFEANYQQIIRIDDYISDIEQSLSHHAEKPNRQEIAEALIAKLRADIQGEQRINFCNIKVAQLVLAGQYQAVREFFGDLGLLDKTHSSLDSAYCVDAFQNIVRYDFFKDLANYRDAQLFAKNFVEFPQKLKDPGFWQRVLAMPAYKNNSYLLTLKADPSYLHALLKPIQERYTPEQFQWMSDEINHVLSIIEYKLHKIMDTPDSSRQIAINKGQILDAMDNVLKMYREVGEKVVNKNLQGEPTARLVNINAIETLQREIAKCKKTMPGLTTVERATFFAAEETSSKAKKAEAIPDDIDIKSSGSGEKPVAIKGPQKKLFRDPFKKRFKDELTSRGINIKGPWICEASHSDYVAILMQSDDKADLNRVVDFFNGAVADRFSALAKPRGETQMVIIVYKECPVERMLSEVAEQIPSAFAAPSALSS